MGAFNGAVQGGATDAWEGAVAPNCLPFGSTTDCNETKTPGLAAKPEESAFLALFSPLAMILTARIHNSAMLTVTNITLTQIWKQNS